MRDKEKRKRIAQLNISKSSVAMKSIGKTIKERPDWYIQKWAILLYALREKFNKPRYKQLLLKSVMTALSAIQECYSITKRTK